MSTTLVCTPLPGAAAYVELTIPSGEKDKFRILSKPEQLRLNPDRYFRSDLTCDAGAAGPVTWRLLTGRKDLVLQTASTYPVKIALPSAALPGCLVSRVVENDLLIDVITEANIWVALSFPLGLFAELKLPHDNATQAGIYQNASSKDQETFGSSYFARIPLRTELDALKRSIFKSTWYHVSAPYDFSARSPIFLRPLESSIAVFFADGGLAVASRDGFDRPIRMSVLADSSYVLSRLARWTWKKETPDNILDAFVVGSRYVVGVSANRTLRAWDMHKRVLVAESRINSQDPALDNSRLGDGTAVPMLAAVGANASHQVDGHTVVFAVRVPLGEESFQIWKFSAENPQLTHIPLMDFIRPNSGDFWFVTGLAARESHVENALDLYLQMQTGTTCIHGIATISESGDVSWSQTQARDASRDVVTCLTPLDHQNHVFLGQYSTHVVETALAVFSQAKKYLGDDSQAKILLREHVSMVVGSEWREFDTICAELQNSASEHVFFYVVDNGLRVITAEGELEVRRALKLEYVAENGGYLSENSDFDSLIGKYLSGEVSGILEEIAKNGNFGRFDFENFIKNAEKFAISEEFSTLSALRIFAAIKSFSDTLLSETLMNLTSSFIEKCDFTNSQKVIAHGNSIFSRFLAHKIPREALETLIDTLNSTPNAMAFIGWVLSTKSALDMPDLANLAAVLTQNISFFRQLLFYVVLMALVGDLGEEVGSVILKEGLSGYKQAVFAQKIARVCISTDSNGRVGIDISGVCSTEKSLLNSVLQKYFRDHEKPSLTQCFSFVFSSEFFYYVLDTLAQAGELHYMLEHVLLMDLERSVVVELYKGLAYLNTGQNRKAIAVLGGLSSRVVEYAKLENSTEYGGASSVNRFLNMKDEAEYFHAISECFIEMGAYTEAQKVAEKAFDLGKKNNSLKNIAQEVAYTLFSISLKTLDFNTAFKTLGFITAPKKELLKHFLHAIVESPDLKNLPTYPFSKEDAYLIDDALVEMAQSSFFGKNSLKGFQVLYSWRLSRGDVRGACEALYLYISQEHVNPNDDVLSEIRLNIVNLLETLDEKERWFLGGQEGDRVVVKLGSNFELESAV